MNKKPLKEESKNTGIMVSDNNIRNYMALFIGLIVLVGVVNFFFQNSQGGTFIQRSWGMNNFSYFNGLVQIVIFAFLLSATVPSVNKRINTWLEKLAQWFDSKKARGMLKILSFAGIAFAFTVLLYIFKIKYDFLGDRDIRVDQSMKGIYVTDEYLTMFLMHHFSNTLSHLLSFTPHRSFVFCSIAAGFVYFFITILIADLLFDATAHKIIFFLFGISVSTIMVFSGYVEIYALPATSVALYIYSCLLFLKNKTKLIFPLLFLILAIALHLEQVSLIPSFAFLAVYRYRFASWLSLTALLVLALVAVPAIYIIYPILHMDPSTVVILKPDPKYPDMFTLLSLTHFREFFNSQFLSGGILVLLVPGMIFISYRKKLHLDDISKFLLIVLLFSIVIVFTDNAMMGSADWDICSFPAISAAMFFAYVSVKLVNKVYSASKINYVLVFALVFNTLNCWAWIGINASDKSITKIKDMMDGDPGYYYQVYMPAEIHLSATYFATKLIPEAEETVNRAYDKYGQTHSRAAYQYVAMKLHHGDTLEAINALKKMISRFPLAEHGLAELALIYEKKHMYEDEYVLGMVSARVFVRDPEKAIEMASKEYFEHIFTYVLNYADMRKDTANAQKAQQLLQALQRYK